MPKNIESPDDLVPLSAEVPRWLRDALDKWGRAQPGALVRSQAVRLILVEKLGDGPKRARQVRA